MQVIHFTRGATDPLTDHGTRGTHFLPLADGEGETHVGCVHLDPGARLDARPLTHAVALLVVHGRIQITVQASGLILRVSAGMGCVFDKDEPYKIASDIGAIVLIVESDLLEAHPRGISNPDRIAGQTWPSDAIRSKA